MSVELERSFFKTNRFIRVYSFFPPKILAVTTIYTIYGSLWLKIVKGMRNVKAFTLCSSGKSAFQ